jgi:ATP-dependent DNA helicase RecG
VFDLQAPVQFVRGIGPQRAQQLERAGVQSVHDLLLHLPLRYEDRTRRVPIAELTAGLRTSVVGTVSVAGLRRGRHLSLFEARVEDESGRLKVLWFNQPYLKNVLSRGRRVRLWGTVEADGLASARLVMSSPQFELLDEGEDDEPGLHAGRIVPVYEKLGPLSGKVLRRVLFDLAESVPADLPDPLPVSVRARLDLIGLGPALSEVHRPPADADVERWNAFRAPGHLRLILEEFFLFQLGLAWRRLGLRRERKRAAFVIDERVREAVKRVLPFRLTGAQRRVLKEIGDDLRTPFPMQRLVQGDVGSGKTVVALLAMVVALENGYQAAFMAPTEILAEQHFLTLQRLLRRQAYAVELLTSALKGAARREALERLADGVTRIAVGTHALIQEGLRFARLGLAVVDEQHRFGVLQRDELRRKGYDVDMLVMTATPIPRTLALTAYGDLDLSVIDERPPGRQPIRTLHVPASARARVLDLLRRELHAGHQAYIVYPLVEESEKLDDVRAATQAAEEWRALLPGVEVGLLHGRLKPQEKEAVMQAFASGASRVLVATTVIEVGVDVPNAALMVIEHAERFGLAQLHQLRGRVGRGAAASTCVLLSHGALAEDARERIETLVRSDDGFALAEKDLELRGAGDFFGTRQWGQPRFRVAQLLRDRALIERARAAAWSTAEEAGAQPAHPLRRFVEGGEWQRRFGLAQVG